jgi:REP element-mobilizing transposase RayT
LKGFDYSGEGEYFVTICAKNHIRYFGKIENEKMILSDIGKIVEKTWSEIPNRFKNVVLDSFQVMPEHFHGIVIIKSHSQNIKRRNLIHQVPNMNIINDVPTKSGIENNPMELKSISLGKIIRWFKGRVSFEAKKINSSFAWQARYYDRIIRNEREHYFIKEYIENNPVNYRKGILREYLQGFKE